MTAYEQLVALAEQELALVTAGELDRLPDVQSRTSRLIDSLPAVPPSAAKPALERAAACHVRTTALLQQRREAIGAELGKLTRGRTAVRGYAPQDPRANLVDRAG